MQTGSDVFFPVEWSVALTQRYCENRSPLFTVTEVETLTGAASLVALTVPSFQASDSGTAVSLSLHANCQPEMP